MIVETNWKRNNMAGPTPRQLTDTNFSTGKFRIQKRRIINCSVFLIGILSRLCVGRAKSQINCIAWEKFSRGRILLPRSLFEVSWIESQPRRYWSNVIPRYQTMPIVFDNARMLQ
ncbi:hypothetical protein PR048_016213 [Dryococelus australis]|uniref:Uncharacterized protein n=1 Tax=Dryococelus australis TaxID=614101 RepID=A0ABQ9HJ42_9NEOP|nr:hypothetical protein PR048_016213 [Dryococelus australis]